MRASTGRFSGGRGRGLLNRQFPPPFAEQALEDALVQLDPAQWKHERFSMKVGAIGCADERHQKRIAGQSRNRKLRLQLLDELPVGIFVRALVERFHEGAYSRARRGTAAARAAFFAPDTIANGLFALS